MNRRIVIGLLALYWLHFARQTVVLMIRGMREPECRALFNKASPQTIQWLIPKR